MLALSAWCDSGVSRDALAGGLLRADWRKQISVERNLFGTLIQTRRVTTNTHNTLLSGGSAFFVVCPPLESFSRGSLDF